MGLLQEAIKTYDCMHELVGKMEAGKEPLAPIGHVIRNGQIEITVDQDGNFVEAKALGTKNGKKIIIPALEESAGRSGSTARPHPLCDQICYVTSADPEKHESYMKQLKEWSESVYATDKLRAIYAYLKQGTILNDLRKAGLIKEKNGKVKNEKDMLCWSVTGLGDKSGPVYQDMELFESWKNYYSNVLDNDGQLDFCYLTGECEEAAKHHIAVGAAGRTSMRLPSDTRRCITDTNLRCPTC